GELSESGGCRRGDTFLPCQMSPADMGGKLVLRVSAIVDEQVGVARQSEEVLVRGVGAVLGVGDIRDGAAIIFKPISGGAARMIKRTRMDNDVGAQDQGLPRQKVLKIDRTRKFSDGVSKQPTEGLFDIAIWRGIAGPKPQICRRQINRRKERQTTNVVDVTLAVDDISPAWLSPFQQRAAQ